MSKIDYVPKVAVGLPVYSGGDLLHGAISSVLNQEFTDLVLLVLDLGQDPRTLEICNGFQKSDSRIQYVNSGEQRNYLGIDSIIRLLDLTSSRYFMWASYDDRHHPSFLRKAIERLDEDSDIALVYFLTQVTNTQGLPISSMSDGMKAEMDDPLERYRHVIWNLNLCNAFYGLFRRKNLLKCKALRKHLYRAYDNLLLAEIALQGKIIQLDEILFTRRMTRPRRQSLETDNADVIHTHDPLFLDEGITFPMCRLVYAHCELVVQFAKDREERNRLLQETLTCFRKRLEPRLRGEIQRALDLLGKNVFYRTWDGREEDTGASPGIDQIDRFRLNSILARMQEACFLYPDWPELLRTYQKFNLGITQLPQTVNQILPMESDK